MAFKGLLYFSVATEGFARKTTLAHLVYEAIESKFQARAFVSVTEFHNMTEVLASILKQVQAADAATLVGTKAATEERLISSTSNFLKDKRYLVIIDDIWHWAEWETLRKSLPDNNLGSRIVTTSRVSAITEKWRDDFDALVCEIDDLDISGVGWMAMDLKREMVGGYFSPHDAILQMCEGMPLALVCMSSALAKECEHQTDGVANSVMEKVKQSGIHNTPGFEPLVESFELGYNTLPHHMLKTCLLYCSIYPEHRILLRDDLVNRWITQGFVCNKEVAADYIDELVSRGFIKKSRNLTPRYSVNPMMRDYLRWKLRQANFITCSSDIIPSSGIGVGRRLCIEHPPPSSDDAPVDPLSGSQIDWSRIRSLVVFEGADKVPYEKLQHLRMLGVQYNGGDLENQHLKDMCRLHRLRHLLGLSGEGISEIPSEIMRLQYLETLELFDTKITRLPAEIADLTQLKTLAVRSSSNNGLLTELPREVGNLHDLERLSIKGANIREPWEVITRLKKLKTLDMSWNRVLEGLPRDIGRLQELRTLDVSLNEGITELPKEIGELQHLETLNISGTRIARLPRDIGKLQNLETLDLFHTNVRKVPREIGELKKLENFDADVAALPFEAGQISRSAGLPRWVQQAWKNSDVVSSLAREIISFQQTYLVTNGGLILGTKHTHVPRWIQEHFNDVGSLDIRICKLEEQDLKILREMPSLEKLALRFEAVPRKPIAISSEGFAKLEYLVVDSRVPRVIFLEGAMPSLRCLTFEFQFYAGPPNTDPVGIKHLASLAYIYFQCNAWYRADSPCISATIDAVRKEAQEHPNCKTRWGIDFVVKTDGRDAVSETFFGQKDDEDSDPTCSSSGADETVPSSDVKTTNEDREVVVSEGLVPPSSQDSNVACSNEVGETEIEEIQA